MVDFSNSETIGTPAVNVEKICILEARINTFLAFEEYNKKKFIGSDVGNSVIRSRLITWFLFHQPYLIRNMTEGKQKEDYNMIIQDLFYNENIDDDKIVEYLFFLNRVCDELRITRLDNFKNIDITDIEAENEAEGV